MLKQGAGEKIESTGGAVEEGGANISVGRIDDIVIIKMDDNAAKQWQG